MSKKSVQVNEEKKGIPQGQAMYEGHGDSEGTNEQAKRSVLTCAAMRQSAQSRL